MQPTRHGHPPIEADKFTIEPVAVAVTYSAILDADTVGHVERLRRHQPSPVREQRP
jgi:hypothetical protein